MTQEIVTWNLSQEVLKYLYKYIEEKSRIFEFFDL